MSKIDWTLIEGSLAAIKGGAKSAKAIGEKVGKHYSTVTRQMRDAEMPLSWVFTLDADDIAKLAQVALDRKKAERDERKAAQATAGRQGATAGIPTLDEMRKGYLTRKEAGSRVVVCKNCGARGAANIRIVGRKGPVLCGECRTSMDLWK